MSNFCRTHKSTGFDPAYNLANNYPNGSVDFFHVHFVIVIVLVIQVLFRSNCTFYLSSFCISVLVLLLK